MCLRQAGEGPEVGVEEVLEEEGTLELHQGGVVDHPLELDVSMQMLTSDHSFVQQTIDIIGYGIKFIKNRCLVEIIRHCTHSKQLHILNFFGFRYPKHEYSISRNPFSVQLDVTYKPTLTTEESRNTCMPV